jgi:hypothetical protein
LKSDEFLPEVYLKVIYKKRKGEFMSNFFFYKDGNKIKPEKSYDKIKFNNGWVG